MSKPLAECFDGQLIPQHQFYSAGFAVEIKLGIFMSLSLLHTDFQLSVPTAERLKTALLEQLENLFSANRVTLGVPMEGRVKAWTSIAEKIQRKALTVQRVSDLDDLVGVRVILLFKPNLSVVEKLLHTTLRVLRAEDTSTRLNESQFGYQSRHYIVTLPDSWLSVPSLAGLSQLKAEIQVRTLAQHIWAAASHKLQYKHEVTVPPPLRRSIHRISALLETVDLEFERLLGERSTYVHSNIAGLGADEPLNVDVLQSLLSELLPAANKSSVEPYAELLEDLEHFVVRTAGNLRALLAEKMDAILQSDRAHVKSRKDSDDYDGTSAERVAAGVFFSHVGLTREALCEKFGHETVRSWLNTREEDA